VRYAHGITNYRFAQQKAPTERGLRAAANCGIMAIFHSKGGVEDEQVAKVHSQGRGSKARQAGLGST